MFDKHIKTEQAELSYFRLSLLSYLCDFHPDKAQDISFITNRSERAAQAYSEAVKSGLEHVQAEKISNEVLFQGLHFSPYNVIVEILENEFLHEFSEDIFAKAKELFPLCKAVFDRYNLSDEFIDKPEYQNFYNELTGAIQIIFDDGIQ